MKHRTSEEESIREINMARRKEILQTLNEHGGMTALELKEYLGFENMAGLLGHLNKEDQVEWKWNGQRNSIHQKIKTYYTTGRKKEIIQKNAYKAEPMPKCELSKFFPVEIPKVDVKPKIVESSLNTKS